MSRHIITIYIFLSFLCSYQFQNKNIILYPLLFIQLIILGINMFWLSKRKEIKISNFILIMIWETLFSAAFNFETLGNYLINTILIFNIYLLTKYKWNYMYKNLYYLAIIFNIINVFIYIYSPKIYSVPKIIFGHELSKIQLQEIGVAAMSKIAMYSLFGVVLIRSKLLKMLIAILSLFILLVGGKFTAILALLVSLIIYIITIKFSLFKNKLKYILKIILITSFSSSFVFYFFIKLLEKLFSVKNIFSGRSVLWIDYIDYIWENKISIFVGNGFFTETKMISYLSHPHNQYLTIIYTLGIFGFIIYYLFFSKNINKIINVVKRYPDLFLLFITQIIQMCGDDYYILTIEPIGMIFLFLIYNIEYSNKRVVQIGEINE